MAALEQVGCWKCESGSETTVGRKGRTFWGATRVIVVEFHDELI